MEKRFLRGMDANTTNLGRGGISIREGTLNENSHMRSMGTTRMGGNTYAILMNVHCFIAFYVIFPFCSTDAGAILRCRPFSINSTINVY